MFCLVQLNIWHLPSSKSKIESSPCSRDKAFEVSPTVATFFLWIQEEGTGKRFLQDGMSVDGAQLHDIFHNLTPYFSLLEMHFSLSVLIGRRRLAFKRFAVASSCCPHDMLEAPDASRVRVLLRTASR